MTLDQKVRLATFNWLNEQITILGDVLPCEILEIGFEFENHCIHIVSPQGIFTPKILDIPLSITTAPKGPYDDSFNSERLHQSKIVLPKSIELQPRREYLDWRYQKFKKAI